MNKLAKLSGPAQTTSIKWLAVIIILVIVLFFIRDMWDKLIQNQVLAVSLIIGILVLIFGGSLVVGKIFKIRK